ncbi:hypothetical protein N7478_002501 [Penicillium angulare]|uniref:uncharacterized protein n=1 Tax=Penicillium angulare TaxID=116970 RepID=UPI0025415460|nr:uncharacterized protein N7478_002501 [Penicillium angulare]KAJ5286815.1 hypothetical protein N7478_002501 [Penicillium angulare]
MPLLRLQPHLFASLPAHSSLTANEARPQLQSFAGDALHEALEFLHTIPSTFTTDPKLRASPPSEAKVKLLRKWRDPSTNNTVDKAPGAEFWVCRQSEHVNANTQGTASWEEFENGLRSNHAENEMDYTPSVTSVEQLMQWSRSDIGNIETQGVAFKDVDMEINLITHTFHPGALIAPRSFISLTISAAYDNTQAPTHENAQSRPLKGFITAQIPLRSTASSTPPGLHQKIVASVPKRAIFASYASVEHVTLLPPTGENNLSLIEWTMATTSDAGGSIPQWVQRNWTMGGVPRAVVADVGLFLGWTMRRRSS